jgi:5-methylcytosine-specific restriction endonuclease McrA
MFLTKEIILERLKEIDERKKAGQSIDQDAEEILQQLKEMGGCKEKKKRGWRDKADPLSLEYEDYRKTKLWKQIKSRIFLRDKNSCQRCGGTADYVHHISYDSIVMLGQDDSKLVALCSGCHEIVHFDSSGVKRNQDEQLAALTDISLNEVMPKVDLRRSSPPSWSRLTSVQKMKWNEEFNQRKLEQLAKKTLKHKLINKLKVEHD